MKPDILFDVPFLLLVALHLYIAPFSKIEEAFNLEATHDILRYGISSQAIEKYDHVAYPGPVPRTFAGPLLLSAISKPWLSWLSEPLQVQIFGI